jgi:hypothetical protein
MADYTQIIRDISSDKFMEIFSASARKAREVYFARHAIKLPKKGPKVRKPGAKNALRAQALFDHLQTTTDDEMVEEILRVWLLGMRPMLGKALDHLGIENDNGLTDSDEVSKIADLDKGSLKKLAAELKDVAQPEDISVYLKFMGAQDVEAAL